MIEVKNISKKYGKNIALNDVSFVVEKGEILGFLGPNGAGKSTTMKIITGFIQPTSGTVVVDGFDILEDVMEVKKRIGYLPENPPLYNDMTINEYLCFAAEIKGIKSINPRVDEVLGMMNLTQVRDRLIKNLSKGYKQRVGLAQAILGNPEVLVLDEPTIGLDPSQIIEIREVIRELGKDRTIILSSHILPEVSQICDRVIIINNGQIVAIDTPENLANKTKSSNIINARIIGEASKILNIINDIEGVIKVQIVGEFEYGTSDFKIESNQDIDIRKDLFNVIAQNDYTIVELSTTKLSLEDVFLQLTTNEAQVDKKHEGGDICE